MPLKVSVMVLRFAMKAGILSCVARVAMNAPPNVIRTDAISKNRGNAVTPPCRIPKIISANAAARPINVAKSKVSTPPIRQIVSYFTKYEYQNFEITAHKMDHGNIDDYGYIVREKGGKTVGFSGDSRMCDNMQYMIDNCDFVIAVTVGDEEPDATDYAESKGKQIVYFDAETLKIRQ